jgi:DNA-binding MarR family transcriptional regulator
MKRSAVSVRDDQALRLASAVSKLRTGLRDARWQVTDLAITQVSILRNLDGMGPMTASRLAAIEHISPQAVAQQLTGLKERGYIETQPDPDDARKTVISLTDDGRALLAAVLESREAWLARAIEETVAPEERADLDRAIDVLERLAAAVTRSGNSY